MIVLERINKVLAVSWLATVPPMVSAAITGAENVPTIFPITALIEDAATSPFACMVNSTPVFVVVGRHIQAINPLASAEDPSSEAAKPDLNSVKKKKKGMTKSENICIETCSFTAAPAEMSS